MGDEDRLLIHRGSPYCLPGEACFYREGSILYIRFQGAFDLKIPLQSLQDPRYTAPSDEKVSSSAVDAEMPDAGELPACIDADWKFSGLDFVVRLPGLYSCAYALVSILRPAAPSAAPVS